MSPEDLTKKLSDLRTALIALGTSKYELTWLETYDAVLNKYLESYGMKAGSLLRLKENYTFPRYFEDKKQHGWWRYRDTFKAGAMAKVEQVHIYSDAAVHITVSFPRSLVESFDVNNWNVPGPIKPEKDKATWFYFKPCLFEVVSESDYADWINNFDKAHFEKVIPIEGWAEGI